MNPEVVPLCLLVMSHGSIAQADSEKAWSLEKQANAHFSYL